VILVCGPSSTWHRFCRRSRVCPWLAQIRQPCTFAGSSQHFHPPQSLHRQSKQTSWAFCQERSSYRRLGPRRRRVCRAEKLLDLLCCTRPPHQKTQRLDPMAPASVGFRAEQVDPLRLRYSRLDWLSWGHLGGPPAVPRAIVWQRARPLSPRRLALQYCRSSIPFTGVLAASSGPLDCKHLPPRCDDPWGLWTGRHCG
jgi:hypothetical protein